MITVTQTRNGESQPTLEFNSPLKAAEHMIEAELAFGARVLCASVNYIQLETRVLHCVDTTTFEASSGELWILKEILYFLQDETSSHLGKRSHLKLACMKAFGLKDEEELTAGGRLPLEDLVAALQLMRESACSFRDALALAS